MLVADVMLSAGCGISAVAAQSYFMHRPNTITALYWIWFIYYFTHIILAPMYALYVRVVNGTAIEKSKLWYVQYFLPYLASQLLVISNPFTHWIYTINPVGNLERGPLSWVIYCIFTSYLVIGGFYLVRYWKAVTPHTRTALCYVFLIVVMTSLIQLIWPFIVTELFGESIALTGIMMLIEYEDDLLDSTTQIYNRKAFFIDVNNLRRTNHNFRLISIRLTNIDAYQRMLSARDDDSIASAIARYLKGVAYDCNIYRTSLISFAIIEIDNGKNEDSHLPEILRDRFMTSWHVENMDLQISAAILAAKVPEEIRTRQDIKTLIDTGVDQEEPVVLLKGEDLSFISRRTEIEKAIRKAIENKSFTVYYQPIYNTHTGRITSAEALVRLIDDKLGFISPGDFIPIAEKDGLIHDVDKIVLEKVCAFEQKHNIRKLGLEHIHVNLSVFQLLSKDLNVQYAEILEKYNITPDLLNLEITESADVNARDDFMPVIYKLQNQGFEFSCDDFGTGYSNLSNIFQMNYRIIKMDKSLLDTAAINDSSRIFLQDTLRTAAKIHMETLQEGVETAEQLKMVTDAGCDLIQGYYFSKPLDSDNFLKYVCAFNRC